MLREISIENFAIIDSISISLEEGMNVLTGETGAGKSIIIDALSQVLGNRSSSSLVKTGAKSAFIEAIFDCDDYLLDVLKEYRIKEDDTLVVSKEIFSNGKTTCKVNYKTVSNTVLKQLGVYLVDIHSQFENQNLLDERNNLKILDQFLTADVLDMITKYKELYGQYKSLQDEYDDLVNQSKQDEEIEYYTKQLEELNQFDFENESVEELEKENDYLKDFEKISVSLNQFKDIMNSGEGIMDLFYSALQCLRIVEDHEDFKDAVSKINELYYLLDDSKEIIIDLYDSLEFDPYRYNEIQEKLFIISKLKRKYGQSVEALIETKQSIEQKIHRYYHRDELIAKLESEIIQCKKECLQLANQITNARKETANSLQNRIEEELHSLYMQNAHFVIDFKETELSVKGNAEVLFLISTNKGMSLQPLSKIVSGGELSRIMLALKTVLLEKDLIQAIVFDEVDTGVSGKVASAIGQKMYSISKHKQVICITHLPQVASYASNHLYISKKTIDDKTTTFVDTLDENQRIEEIAKMLSDESITDAAKQQALILLSKKDD